MSDYISREEAIMAVTRAKLPDTTPEGVPIANGKRSVTDCVRRIKDIPAADVRPVVRGTWIVGKSKWNDSLNSYTCPICGSAFQDIGPENFCANCGADMRGENDV